MKVSAKNEVRIDSWNALADALFGSSFDSNLHRFRSNNAFRGVADARWGLQTSLMRLGGDFKRLEEPILRSFRKYAHRDAAAGDSVWNWLTVAQHHGLPTRLLDWTYSPFVALHFATHELKHMSKDAVIWCVDFVAVRETLPQPMFAILEKEYTNAFTVDLLSREVASLAQLDKLSKKDCVVFFEPPSLDDRVVNQYALFSMMNNSEGLLDQWLKEHSDLYTRIIIPTALKWEIRDKLDQLNINERTLFPGLDGLSRWLTRHYSPGPRGEQPVKQVSGGGREGIENSVDG